MGEVRQQRCRGRAPEPVTWAEHQQGCMMLGRDAGLGIWTDEQMVLQREHEEPWRDFCASKSGKETLRKLPVLKPH